MYFRNRHHLISIDKIAILILIEKNFHIKASCSQADPIHSIPVNCLYPKKNKDILKEITYHDPCHLGRLSGVYEEPREILNKCGYKVNELSKNRENLILIQ